MEEWTELTESQASALIVKVDAGHRWILGYVLVVQEVVILVIDGRIEQCDRILICPFRCVGPHVLGTVEVMIAGTEANDSVGERLPNQVGKINLKIRNY